MSREEKIKEIILELINMDIDDSDLYCISIYNLKEYLRRLK